jgi:hypothetical protein
MCVNGGFKEETLLIMSAVCDHGWTQTQSMQELTGHKNNCAAIHGSELNTYCDHVLTLLHDSCHHISWI